MFDGKELVEEGIPIEYFATIDKCDTFVDIGAYHGLYTAIVGKINEILISMRLSPITRTGRY
jgi:hypothetical protein